MQEVTGKISQRQKRYYDRKVREINYDIGELVRRNQPKIITGTKAKLARSLTGPWIIVQRLSDVLYQIRHSTSSKLVVVHADNLKLFKKNVPGAADDNLYRDDDNDIMTGGEKLHGDGETSKKLRPDDTDGSEVPDQTVPDDQSEREFNN